MAQAAVEAAHLEENVLLWAGRELTSCTALQLLAQAEAWNGPDMSPVYLTFDEISQSFLSLGSR